MNKNKFQSGSAHLIIIVILSLALIGSLGFLYYQNFVQKDDISKTDDVKTTPTPTQTTPIVDPTTVVNDFLTSFLNYMAMPTTDSHNETSFASQSPVLTDTYKDSIVNPSGMVYSSPIILAQALPLGFSVGTATTTSTSSSVPVVLSYNTPFSVVYNLVLVGNEWKIDGVTKI